MGSFFGARKRGPAQIRWPDFARFLMNSSSPSPQPMERRSTDTSPVSRSSARLSAMPKERRPLRSPDSLCQPTSGVER